MELPTDIQFTVPRYLSCTEQRTPYTVYRLTYPGLRIFTHLFNLRTTAALRSTLEGGRELSTRRHQSRERDHRAAVDASMKERDDTKETYCTGPAVHPTSIVDRFAPLFSLSKLLVLLIVPSRDLSLGRFLLHSKPRVSILTLSNFLALHLHLPLIHDEVEVTLQSRSPSRWYPPPQRTS